VSLSIVIATGATPISQLNERLFESCPDKTSAEHSTRQKAKVLAFVNQAVRLAEDFGRTIPMLFVRHLQILESSPVHSLDQPERSVINRRSFIRIAVTKL
jgi:hypothetical protein